MWQWRLDSLAKWVQVNCRLSSRANSYHHNSMANCLSIFKASFRAEWLPIVQVIKTVFQASKEYCRLNNNTFLQTWCQRHQRVGILFTPEESLIRQITMLWPKRESAKMSTIGALETSMNQEMQITERLKLISLRPFCMAFFKSFVWMDITMRHLALFFLFWKWEFRRSLLWTKR